MRSTARADDRASAVSGFRRATLTNDASRTSESAASAIAAIQCARIAMATAIASAAVASANTTIGGVTPKYLGITASYVTGLAVVSYRGRGTTSVSSPLFRPQAGQNCASGGSAAPQRRQLLATADTRPILETRLERLQRLGRLPAVLADERAVIVVGDLAGAVVELELLERCKCAVALLA